MPTPESSAPAPATSATRVEIKFAVALEQTDQALAAFTELQQEPAHQREIRFYDSANLGLLGGGFILRTRLSRKGNKPGDSTVKVRGELANSISDDLLKTPAGDQDVEAKREGDWILAEGDLDAGQPKPSVSITASVARDLITGADTAPVGKLSALFLLRQAELVKSASGQPIPWNDLRTIGPVATSQWKLHFKWPPDNDDDFFTAELWVTDGLRVIEFSCKPLPAQVNEKAELLKETMKAKGLHGLGKSKAELVMRHLLGSHT